MAETDDKARVMRLREVAKQKGWKLLKYRHEYRLLSPDGGETRTDLDGIEQYMEMLSKGVTLETTTACGMPIGKLHLEW